MYPTINIVQPDWGIGDIICSLYAVQAFSTAHPKTNIKFHVRQHKEWAELADIERMDICLIDDKKTLHNKIMLYNLDEDKKRYIKHQNSPKHYSCTKLNVKPETPRIKSEIVNSERLFEEKYIVLSPYASQINRTWEIHNWKILARLLKSYGYKVIAIDSPFQSERCKVLDIEFFWGQPAQWIAQLCKHAELIIGNDSGIAHLGGWLNIRTLVVMSQLNPNQFYANTNNRFMIPQHRCTGCRFIPDYGYEEKCDSGCWVLQSVRPQEVFDHAISWLKEQDTKYSKIEPYVS